MQKLKLFCLVLLLVLAGYFLLKPEQEASNANINLPVSSTTPTKQVFTDMQLNTKNVNPKIAKFFEENTFQEEYVKSRNYRAFVEKAKNHPELGGSFYAWQSLAWCSTFNKIPALTDGKEDPVLFAKRLEAINFWKDRCQGLLSSDTASDVVAKTVSTEALAKDLLNNLQEDLKNSNGKKSEKDKFRSQLKYWLQVKNPQLFAYGSQYMGGMPGDVPGSWFDGETFSDSDAPIISAAWVFVICHFGGGCDRFDPFVAQACVVKKQCFNNRFELYQNVDFKNRPQDYQRAINLYQRLVKAIIDENVDAFIKPDD